MELIDFTKKICNAILPKRHQLLLITLFSGLLVILVIKKSEEAGTHTDNSITALSSHSFLQSPLLSNRTDLDKPGAESAPENALKRLSIEVQSGDNLSLLFNKAGLGPADVYKIANSSNDAASLAELYPGYRLAFEIDSESKLKSLEVIKTPLESLVFTLADSGDYEFRQIQKDPQFELVFKEAIITDSLFQAAQRNGLPPLYADQLAKIFGGVVDFIFDIRAGDFFNVVYEEQYLEGEFIGHGKVLAAQLSNQGEIFTAVRYKNARGEENFYNPEGESMQKAFWLNPVDFTRISSGFALARRHPILNTIRAHKGTDYAAPKGTPVVATADGRITFVGRKGTFGKLVVIQHGDKFETRYAHLDGYHKGIGEGVRVAQGQVIGYVGSTGGATGPHLHYEFLMDGVQRNSRTIHDLLPRAEAVASTELPQFRQQTQALLALLANKGRQPNTIARSSPLPAKE
jgi:murein DD-endopeptidase MepM/ murein hydrolase activator NlpD